jgi:hypothetical protein
VAHDHQPAEGHDEDRPEYLLEELRRSAAVWQEVAAGTLSSSAKNIQPTCATKGSLRSQPVKSDPAVQANDEDGKSQCRHCESFERWRVMAVQANCEDDDHEETGQIGTQPQQRRAGDVLAQQD